MRYAIKVRGHGAKRYAFLGSDGKLWGLRIRASTWSDRKTAERAALCITEDNPGYEARVVVFAKD